MPIGIIREEHHRTSVPSIAPHLLITRVTARSPIVGGLLVVGAFVQLFCHPLHIIMDAILVILKHIITLGMAVDHIDRLLASLPFLATQRDTTGRCKSCNLILNVRHTVVHQHRAHGEPRPIDTILVDGVFGVHLIDGFQHKVTVFRSPCVPTLIDAIEIGDDELLLIDQFIHVITTGLITRILVHAMRYNHQRQIARDGIGSIHDHLPILPIHFDGQILLLVGKGGQKGQTQDDK